MRSCATPGRIASTSGSTHLWQLKSYWKAAEFFARLAGAVTVASASRCEWVVAGYVDESWSEDHEIVSPLRLVPKESVGVGKSMIVLPEPAPRRINSL